MSCYKFSIKLDNLFKRNVFLNYKIIIFNNILNLNFLGQEHIKKNHS